MIEESGTQKGIGAAKEGTAAETGRTPSGHVKSPRKFRMAVTGDFENLALTLVPWNTLGDNTEVVVFTKPLVSVREAVQAL
ncbi:MAG: hypothetical protein ACRDFS_13480, partial [Chloroflexota bacterium]